MTKLLTALAVQNLKPRDERRSVPVGGARGLYVEVLPSGRKRYHLRYRFSARTRNLTLDAGLTLAEARAAAAAAWVEIERGVDPAVVKQANKEKARAAKVAVNTTGDTVERYAEQFLAQHCRRKTSASHAKQAEHVFRAYALPRWRGRSISEITRRDVKEVIRTLALEKPVMANRTLAHLSRFFRWCLNEDIIAASPAVGIERPAKETPRDRILSDDEIRSLRRAIAELPAPIGGLFWFLLLTACRKSEGAEAKWSEFDFANRVWTIPRARAKGGKTVVLPLGEKAFELVERQPRIAGSDYVWGRPRSSGLNFFKPKLDEIMKPATPWTIHDLRRTSRSLMSRAGVAGDTAERCLGHLVGGTIVRTYDHFEFVDEKRRAFEALESLIGAIVEGTPDNVVRLLPQRG